MRLSRCAIEEFKRSSDSWRSHAKTAAALRSEFAELLGDDEQPAQPDQIAQPDGQQDASGAQKVPAASRGKAKASKARKSEKGVSTQPLQHDVSEKQHDNGAMAAGGTDQPKKRKRGLGAPASGPAAPPAAEVHAEHADSAAQVMHTFPIGDSAATAPAAVTQTDSTASRRNTKRSASCLSGDTMPAAADERIGTKRTKRKVMPAGLSPEAIDDGIAPRERQGVKTEGAGKKKKVRKQ